MPIRSQSSLKPSFSQLLLRSLENQDDPKYATVPVIHFDEVRPSILEQYQYKETLTKSDENCAKVCNDGTANLEGTQSSTSTSNSSKPLMLRALNWSVEPIWRYCVSKIHLELEKNTKLTPSTVKKQESKKMHKKSKNALKKCPSQLPETSNKAAESKRNKVDVFTYHQTLLNEEHEMPIRCSRAAFELLPPLYESRTHTLLYQNSYLLDGVKYDYGPYKNNHERCVRTRLRLNYLKFLRSVSKNSKPSDREVVFGEAKVIINPAPHWEGSRIDWLLNLEKQYELRQKQSIEAEEELKEIKNCRKLAKNKNFRFHLKQKRTPQDKYKEKVQNGKK